MATLPSSRLQEGLAPVMAADCARTPTCALLASVQQSDEGREMQAKRSP